MPLLPLLIQHNLLGILGVDTKNGVSPQGGGCTHLATGPGQGLSLKGVDGLVVAHLDGEVAVEVGLGDVELDAVHVGENIPKFV